MPARSGHAHSEDLPWLEVPHPVPAAEEESDSGVSLVPPICGEAPFFFRRNALKTTYKAKRKNRIVHSVFSIFSPFFSISQQQKKYQRIKSATTLVQSYTRGWQVRTFMCIAQNQV